MQLKAFRNVNVLVALVMALGFVGAVSAPTYAAPEVNPEPVQIYYVTLPEGDALTVLDTINSAADAPMHTYFSIAIATNDTWVYYDHWEDGYEADIANPTQATTEIWGNGIAADGCAPNKSGVAFACTDAADVLNAGDVIVPYNTMPVPVPLVPTLPTLYVLDQFSSQSYSNNNGNTNWAGPWVERNDSGTAQSPTSGRITITSNQLRFTEASANDAIDRGVDLSNYGACAVLSFDLGQSGVDNFGDNFSVRMSSDGVNYTALDTFTGPGSAGSKSYNISSYATANTRVRFQADQALETGEYWSVDNVRVEWDCKLYYNAKDKVGASKSIAMARATWASGSGTLNAFAHEMYSTSEWGTTYESPVGTNTANAGQMFEYSGLTIMASQNNTGVAIDADANGSYEINVVLNEGGATLISGIQQGARVESDKPVQVVLLTGDIGSNYASRDMNLLPTNAYGSSYWSPVGVVNSTNNTRLFLYNPSSNSPVYITCERRDAANVTLGPVAARGVATIDLVNNQGARCYASTSNGTPTDDKISGVGTIDTTGAAYDWSFTLYPDNFLTTDALVGLGLGRDPDSTTSPTQNGSPLWVTAACTTGSTYVYVDWNNDGTPDLIDLNGDGDTNDTVDGISESTSNQGISVNRLQSVRLFRPGTAHLPFAQTGARVWSRTASGVGFGGDPGCNLSVAWGEDPRTASAAAPGLDVGTSVPPLRLVESSKGLGLKVDNDGDGLLSPGDIATYLITVFNAGPTLVQNVYLYDVVPANTTYVAGTTESASALPGPWTLIPDSPNPGDLPLAELPNGVFLGNLDAGDSFYVRFDVLLGFGDYGEINNCSLATTAAGDLTRCAIDQVASMDWGDLPDSYGTSAASDGPRHSPSNLRLGAWFDREVQGQPSAGANGDDVNETSLPHGNDEDGVTVLQADVAFEQITFRVIVTDTDLTNEPACLNAWMDFTNDAGSCVGLLCADGNFTKNTGYDMFGAYSEHIIQNQLLSPGTHDLTYSGPPGLLTNGQTNSFYVRFRLSPTNGGVCTSPIAPTGFVSGGEVEDYRFSFDPLAVTLAEFSAAQQNDAVVVNWVTVSEVDNRGFNLYRGTSPDGPDLQLNAQLIPSQGPGSTQGFAYTWQDRNELQAGVTYYYWLEDVSLSGSTSMHGPVSVNYTGPTAVTLGSVSASPAAAAPGLAWLWVVVAAGAAVGVGRLRRRG